jgi:hypothetical protein
MIETHFGWPFAFIVAYDSDFPIPGSYYERSFSFRPLSLLANIVVFFVMLVGSIAGLRLGIQIVSRFVSGSRPPRRDRRRFSGEPAT